jgi:bifunctional non-homologous end joining protein LigD
MEALANARMAGRCFRNRPAASLGSLAGREGGDPAALYSTSMSALTEYRRKRDFRATPEPKGRREKSGHPIFVVQRHAASRLHFDFRLEINGALASWAVPKGPPEERGEKRLAIHVEDHPLDYANFEGEIPKGNYGAGEVQIWDRGTFQVEGPQSAAEQVERGDLKFSLEGQRLRGRFALVKMRSSRRGNEWLLIRKTDREARESARESAAGDGARGTKPRAGGVRIEAFGDLAGAKKAAMPDQVAVELATLAEKPFSSPDWLFEIKWDGERALAFIRDGEMELRSRSARNITAEYPELRELAKRVNARKAILDGEIVVLDESGRSEFARIQPRFGVQNPPRSLQEKAPVTYYAFDLLYADGYDLRGVSLELRKQELRKILSLSERVRFSDHQVEKGVELFEVAKQQRLEGIIAKRRDSVYAGRRSPQWMKFKIVRDTDVVVGGFTAPRKTRDHFGALLMGLWDERMELHYIGSVGTGFTQESLDRTFKTLSRREVTKSPFHDAPRLKESITWVKPELVARIQYGNWTNDRKLRQPVFLGFQEDREPQECRLEDQEFAHPPRRTKKAIAEAQKEPRGPKMADAGKSSPLAAGASRNRVPAKNLEEELTSGKGESVEVELGGKRLNLTHLNKVWFPKNPVLRKRDVLAYYLRVAPHILPFLKDRPMVLKRYPNGIGGKFFFQKAASASRPAWIRTVLIESKDRGEDIPYFLVDDVADLLYLTNLGCVDHNPWSSRADDQQHPDFVFFDLDPTDGTSFESVLRVARAVEKHLRSMRLRSYPKTSGATGVHIFVPIEPQYSYEEVRLFAGAIGQRVAADLPNLITSERSVGKRKKGTVLIDALQNSLGKPLAAVYSLRPAPGAPVSTPLSPAELQKGFRPEDFTIATIFTRLKRSGDLWQDFWKHRQNLKEAVTRA